MSIRDAIKMKCDLTRSMVNATYDVPVTVHAELFLRLSDDLVQYTTEEELFEDLR